MAGRSDQHGRPWHQLNRSAQHSRPAIAWPPPSPAWNGFSLFGSRLQGRVPVFISEDVSGQTLTE